MITHADSTPIKNFDLPRRPDQSTYGARRAYREFFIREWPHGDVYLREIAATLPADKNAWPAGTSKCETLLWAMRDQDADQ